VPSENHATAVKPSRQRQVLSSNSRQLTSTRREGRHENPAAKPPPAPAVIPITEPMRAPWDLERRWPGAKEGWDHKEWVISTASSTGWNRGQSSFEPVLRRTKNFELRKNDRGYKIGDVLLLREWDPKTKIYSGRECRRTVEYVLEGIGTGGIEPLKGLSIGYCILGLS
jgi:Domain of unknown function (DUF3850)